MLRGKKNAFWGRNNGEARGTRERSTWNMLRMSSVVCSLKRKFSPFQKLKLQHYLAHFSWSKKPGSRSHGARSHRSQARWRLSWIVRSPLHLRESATWSLSPKNNLKLQINTPLFSVTSLHYTDHSQLLLCCQNWFVIVSSSTHCPTKSIRYKMRFESHSHDQPKIIRAS